MSFPSNPGIDYPAEIIRSLKNISLKFIEWANALVPPTPGESLRLAKANHASSFLAFNISTEPSVTKPLLERGRQHQGDRVQSRCQFQEKGVYLKPWFKH